MVVDCWDLIIGFIQLLGAVGLIGVAFFLFLVWREERKEREEILRLSDELRRVLKKEGLRDERC